MRILGMYHLVSLVHLRMCFLELPKSTIAHEFVRCSPINSSVTCMSVAVKNVRCSITKAVLTTKVSPLVGSDKEEAKQCLITSTRSDFTSKPSLMPSISYFGQHRGLWVVNSDIRRGGVAPIQEDRHRPIDIRKRRRYSRFL